MSEPDNLVLVHLHELREEMRARFTAVDSRLGAMEERLGAMEDRLTSMDRRIDAMHLNGVKALRGFIGHRAMTERAMASIEDQLIRLEERVVRLETTHA